MQKNNLQFLSKLVPTILVLVLVFGGIFSLIKVEILTKLYKDTLNVDEICKSLDVSKLKYGKVLEYENYKKTSQIYCIFEDPSKNLDVHLNYQNNRWAVFTHEKLNQKGKLYWPIYLYISP